MGLFKPKRPRIFVQIASYRDPECQWTVKDMFEQAAHPERIFAGICWQYDKKADKECFTVASPRPRQTRMLHCKVSDSEGVCWARHYAQTLYKDEEYVLMIDSHMRFTKHWDELLIKELARCPSKKPLLTHYPPGYTPPRTLLPDPKLSVMIIKGFDAEGGTRSDGIVLERVPDAPLRGAFVAAGFIFAKAAIIVDVPYDPYMYFNQEEISFAARLYTKGWDVYHPTRVCLYHCYKKANDESQQKLLHWGNDKEWHKLHMRGHRRLHHLVRHKLSKNPQVIKEIKHYGLGKTRTLSQFETFSGINFKKLTASDRATKAGFVPNLEQWTRLPEPVTASLPHTLESATSTRGKSKFASPAPLQTGDMLPPFVLPDATGVSCEIQRYAGQRLILFFLPLDFPDYMAAFFDFYAGRLESLQRSPYRRLFIVHGTAEEARALQKKYPLAQPLLHDATGALHHSFGLGKKTRLQPLSVLLNANQKIFATYHDRNAINQLADVVRVAESPASAPAAYLANQIHPPVLIVPEIIPQALLNELLLTKIKGRKTKSKKPVSTVELLAPALWQSIDQQMAKAVLPELRKIGAFEALYRAPYQLHRYSQPMEYTALRRSTGSSETAHRRYTMSLALTDDYEGGLLYFPEYGGMHYKIAAGSAILFPSPMLHAVTPVTKGERVALVSHFHGPLEEAYRKKQLKARGAPYREEDMRLLVEPRFALPQSPHLYTSSIITRVMDD